MAKIITTSELQKTIGQLLSYIGRSWVVVTNRGKPTAIMLPYFDDNEEAISDYLENYEMNKNASELRRQLRESEARGLSSLVI